MKNKLNLDWLKAAGIRAIKTMAQTALGMITVGMAVQEVSWVHVASVAAVAGILSILTSLATNLPELSTNTPVVTNTITQAPKDT